jgi:hypothetical protein
VDRATQIASAKKAVHEMIQPRPGEGQPQQPAKTVPPQALVQAAEQHLGGPGMYTPEEMKEIMDDAIDIYPGGAAGMKAQVMPGPLGRTAEIMSTNWAKMQGTAAEQVAKDAAGRNAALANLYGWQHGAQAPRTWLEKLGGPVAVQETIPNWIKQSNQALTPLHDWWQQNVTGVEGTGANAPAYLRLF